jgi:hypothetical protein
MFSYLAPVFGISKDQSTHLAVVAMALAISRMRCITTLPNNRLEFARTARPTSKGDAPLLAAQPGRSA